MGRWIGHRPLTVHERHPLIHFQIPKSGFDFMPMPPTMLESRVPYVNPLSALVTAVESPDISIPAF
jgi:hypothetical protein